MKLPEAPRNWGIDEITNFFDFSRNNEYSSFSNLQSEINRLVDIDLAYRKIIGGLNHSKEWFSVLFILRSHSNYLAACRMSLSGQIPECYALLRSCLENLLYGIYLAHNVLSRETWLRRHDSDEYKKKVRDEFKVSTMLKLAKSIDNKEGVVAEQLYELTIDHGAHPNERALMQSLHMSEKGDDIEFMSIYLDANPDHLRFVLKTTAQISVCSLSLFRPIYKERYDILGVTAALEHIKRGI